MRLVYPKLISNVKISFSQDNSIIMLAISPIVYFTLYAYLDNVLPSEYGTRKGLCFCLSSLFTRKKR